MLRFIVTCLPTAALWVLFHCGRHTFATTITLGNGVPIETVSKMLGHTNVRTTQIYARITDQKINVDMESLAAKLNGIFTAPLTPSKESVRREQHQREVQKFAVAAGLA
ncbi:tyrosine-type recombinase/integrase [uncultured Alistipes sp.]|uniref:tyrosine-type recombinase/integrase n=1 Tax=uncultured Alistipes sp. TaxID=538949 RepID=UPI0025FF88C0|nr:tyrosine-type recombinase/integrase [uncultured Alistipes sp.]